MLHNLTNVSFAQHNKVLGREGKGGGSGVRASLFSQIVKHTSGEKNEPLRGASVCSLQPLAAPPPQAKSQSWGCNVGHVYELIHHSSPEIQTDSKKRANSKGGMVFLMSCY